MSGIMIKWSDRMLYLGITFLFGLRLNVDFACRLVKYHAVLSTIFKDKVHGFENIYVRIIATKCLPILFHDLNCLSVYGNLLQSVSKAWNMAFRWIFGLRKFDSIISCC
jgi:hypothetical protein